MNSTLKKQMLTFFIKDNMFAIPLSYIQEVIKYPKVYRVPMVDDFVMGLMNLRGRVLSVINVSKLLGLPQEESTLNSEAIICFANNHWLALCVPQVGDVEEMADDNSVYFTGTGNKFSENVFKLNKRMGSQINIEEIFHTLGEKS